MITLSNLVSGAAKARLGVAPPAQAVVPDYQPLDPLPEQPDLVGLAEHGPGELEGGDQADPISLLTWPKSR